MQRVTKFTNDERARAKPGFSQSLTQCNTAQHKVNPRSTALTSIALR